MPLTRANATDDPWMDVRGLSIHEDVAVAADTLWEILGDFGGLVAWNPFVHQLMREHRQDDPMAEAVIVSGARTGIGSSGRRKRASNSRRSFRRSWRSLSMTTGSSLGPRRCARRRRPNMGRRQETMGSPIPCRRARTGRSRLGQPAHH
jgi:hypothetical protein